MFQKSLQKSVEQENSGLIMKSILLNGKMRVENQTKTLVWEDSILCPENSTKNDVQEFHLSSHFYRYRVPYTLVSVDKFDNFYFN